MNFITLHFLKKHWYGISIIVILIVASVLRFYSYDHRWGLAYDQAHDAIVAREALRQHKLPLLGPFSSAGPFVTGPEWYWFIMLSTFIFPFSVITPWVVLTVLYVFLVYVMIKIGEETGGGILGIILGLLTAVSTAEISQAVNLTNQAPLTILSALALWAALYYLKTKKTLLLFFLGFFISLAINTHLQGVLLFPFLILTLIFCRSSLKGVLYAVIGFVLPFLPLIYFDITNHFYNIRHMLQYYLHDQYKISLNQFGRNWKTYLAVFWPQAFAKIIGGYTILSYFVLLVISTAVVFTAFKKSIPKIVSLVFLSLFVAIIFLRYTRTPLFDSYLMFLHPWLLFIVGWSIYWLVQKVKLFGILFLSVIVVGSLLVDVHNIIGGTNIAAANSANFRTILKQTYPTKKLVLYDYKRKNTMISFPLSLYLEQANMTDDKGRRVGIVISGTNPPGQFPNISHDLYRLVDLSSSSSADLQKGEWVSVNPSGIYHDTEEWFLDKKLQKSVNYN